MVVLRGTLSDADRESHYQCADSAQVSNTMTMHRSYIRSVDDDDGDPGNKNLCRRLLRLRGSVFPWSFFVAFPVGLVTMVLKWFMLSHGPIKLFGEDWKAPINNSTAWTAYSSLLGFLIVFRTSQAYSRFWEGCSHTYVMGAEWYHACSALIAFCRHSPSSSDKRIRRFQHTLVRLFSLLHALALTELEGSSEHSEYELLDIQGLDAETLEFVRLSPSKVQLVFTWIQCLTVEAARDGVLTVPPPILSRAFQEIANGMVAFHDAMKLCCIPFPFPYTQTCDVLLIIHLGFTPIVVCNWVDWISWAGAFAFVQVFVLWALHFIAMEIEKPFGTDSNDLDGHQLQSTMNTHLLTLLSPSASHTPSLSSKAVLHSQQFHILSVKRATTADLRKTTSNLSTLPESSHEVEVVRDNAIDLEAGGARSDLEASGGSGDLSPSSIPAADAEMAPPDPPLGLREEHHQSAPRSLFVDLRAEEATLSDPRHRPGGGAPGVPLSDGRLATLAIDEACMFPVLELPAEGEHGSQEDRDGVLQSEALVAIEALGLPESRFRRHLIRQQSWLAKRDLGSPLVTIKRDTGIEPFQHCCSAQAS